MPITQTVIQGKCQEVLQQFPDQYFDILVLDPPESMGDSWFNGLEAYQFMSRHGISRVVNPLSGVFIILTNPMHGYVKVKGTDIGDGNFSFKQTFHEYPDIAPAAEFGLPHVRPLGVMLEILSEHVHPWSKILDPFCGSGTTLEAAQILRCEAVGIDIEETCVNVARNRLAVSV